MNQCSSKRPVVHYAELAAAQHVDAKLQRLRITLTIFTFKAMWMPGSDDTVACNMSTG